MDNSSTVRPLTTAEDLLKARQISAVAFVSSFDATKFTMPEPGPSQVWGYGDPLTSTMHVHDFGVWFDGSLVKCAGIGGVASLPEGRGQGGIRSLFASLMPKWKKEDIVFSTLYPFSHLFYRKFGYELVQRTHRYRLPMAALSVFPRPERVTMITQWNPSDDNPLMLIHRDFGKQINLAVLRKDAQWRVAQDPYRDVRYTYLIGDDAFVTFTKDAKPDADLYTLRVEDLAYRTPQALREIFGFLYALRAQYGQVDLSLPPSVPLTDMIPECYDVSLEVQAHGMARVVHVQRALELMRYPQETGALCIHVDDAFLPENTGLYLVRYAQGKAQEVTRERFGGRPDLKVSVQRFTQLVLGSLSLSQALWLSDVECYVDPSRLTPIFPKKDVFFSDYF